MSPNLKQLQPSRPLRQPSLKLVHTATLACGTRRCPKRHPLHKIPEQGNLIFGDGLPVSNQCKLDLYDASKVAYSEKVTARIEALIACHGTLCKCKRKARADSVDRMRIAYVGGAPWGYRARTDCGLQSRCYAF